MDTDVQYASPDFSIDKVARIFATYNSMMIPVLDDEFRLLGAISVDDLLDHMLPEDWRDQDE
jgi:Mg/Co/Ni transporter MgtE